MHCTEIWPGSGSHARTAGSHHRELGSYFVTRAAGQGWALRTKLYRAAPKDPLDYPARQPAAAAQIVAKTP